MAVWHLVSTSGREQTSLVMKSFQKHIFKKRIQLSLLMEFTVSNRHTHSIKMTITEHKRMCTNTHKQVIVKLILLLPMWKIQQTQSTDTKTLSMVLKDEPWACSNTPDTRSDMIFNLLLIPELQTCSSYTINNIVCSIAHFTILLWFLDTVYI